MPPATLHDALDRARDAYQALAELGESIDDEWSYVTDLTTAWTERFDEVDQARGDSPIAPDVAAAIDRAADEIVSITDPHRAIDWLSTFPQVVLVAVGERP